jgi:hypothetical protein
LEVTVVPAERLVAFAVSRINIRGSTAISPNVCATMLFTGRMPDFRNELSLFFGDYCRVFDGTDNTVKSRTIPCIALYPCCNMTGSWVFYSLQTKTWIRRKQWKNMVTLAELIENMNAFDTEVAILELVGGGSDVQSPEEAAGSGNMEILLKNPARNLSQNP